MLLNHENYFSNEANFEFMSRSQYKGFLECEAKEIAKLSGEWVEEVSIALMVGSYVHSWSQGTQREFIANCPQMFKKDGSLKAEYIGADNMIDCLQNDDFAMYCLEGDKEVIITFEMFGAPWKVMLDVQNNERRRIVDLKTTRSITEKVWDEETRKKVSFVEAYSYPLQMAIYSEGERISEGREPGDYSEFLIVAVSKEKQPDKAIINMTDHTRLEVELAQVEVNMPRILAVKAGIKEPVRCEVCDYCRSTKRLTGAIHYSEL
ncbi:MAG TPA: PD-(D/E)XK nuclease-like domain-containing protein [Desulfosporosinus sp.]|nr:PD-(D/E)XK nuclease-like domain-containing protein [Desulfosporosinus sp.]